MKTWNIQKTQFKVGNFISWQKSNTLILNPAFQRRPVWLPGQKSLLIDTIVRGLPIPIIFLRERPTDLDSFVTCMEVIDGQQRIRTVISYIDSSLLKDFNEKHDRFTVQKTHNRELAGKKFLELDKKIKSQILDYQFSVHTLPSEVDDRNILEIFGRMNSTGVKLNKQELRNAKFFGEFKTTMYSLAYEQLERWRKWKIFSDQEIARMAEVESTSDYIIMMLQGVTGRDSSNMDKVYYDYDVIFIQRDEVSRRYRIVLDTIDEKFGDFIRFSQFRKQNLFYFLFTYVYFLQYGQESSLSISIREKMITDNDVKVIKDVSDRIEKKISLPQEISDAISGRQTHSSVRKLIINYLLSLRNE